MRRLQLASSFFFVQYLLAMLAVGVTTAAVWILRASLSSPVIVLLYLLPVVLCASVWGLGPGVASALCAFLLFNYFFIPPYYTLAVHQTQDLLALVVFLFVAVVITSALSIALFLLVALIERCVLPWYYSAQRGEHWEESGIY